MDARLMVLNKIDTLWDELTLQEQVQAQIERQCAGAAQLLGVQPDQVVAVSAQRACWPRSAAMTICCRPVACRSWR